MKDDLQEYSLSSSKLLEARTSTTRCTCDHMCWRSCGLNFRRAPCQTRYVVAAVPMKRHAQTSRTKSGSRWCLG